MQEFFIVTGFTFVIRMLKLLFPRKTLRFLFSTNLTYTESEVMW